MVNTAKKWYTAKKRSRTMTGGGAPLPDPPEYIQHVDELYQDSANFCGIEGETESEGLMDLQTREFEFEQKDFQEKNQLSDLIDTREVTPGVIFELRNPSEDPSEIPNFLNQES